MKQRLINLNPLAVSFLVILLFIFQNSRAQIHSDISIKQRIEAKVVKAPELNKACVNVYVENGNVVLTGHVRFYLQKMMYEKIGWQTEGVKLVDNEIVVKPLFRLDDTTIKRKIRGIIKASQQLQISNVTITVKNGNVHIKGKVLHPNNVLILKHKIAEIEGVVAIEMRISFGV